MAITPETKISDLLERHPELLDVLADYDPAFGKLRNPLLRRTFGRLTSLAQAASIGRVELSGLLRTLREAAGEAELTATEGEREAPVALPESAATSEPPRWLEEEQVSAEFDARPLQERGEDPFSAIMAAVADVPEGRIFYLRNTFEPLPLYEVLGKRGFVPWARQNASDDWEIFFYKRGRGESELPAVEEATSGAPPAADQVSATLTIDPGQLTPPEPLMRILESLAELEPGDTLLVHHVRRPAYLYPKLNEMGHGHRTWELGPERVDILIEVGVR